MAASTRQPRSAASPQTPRCGNDLSSPGSLATSVLLAEVGQRVAGGGEPLDPWGLVRLARLRLQDYRMRGIEVGGENRTHALVRGGGLPGHGVGDGVGHVLVQVHVTLQ